MSFNRFLFGPLARAYSRHGLQLQRRISNMGLTSIRMTPTKFTTVAVRMILICMCLYALTNMLFWDGSTSKNRVNQINVLRTLWHKKGSPVLLYQNNLEKKNTNIIYGRTGNLDNNKKLNTNINIHEQDNIVAPFDQQHQISSDKEKENDQNIVLKSIFKNPNTYEHDQSAGQGLDLALEGETKINKDGSLDGIIAEDVIKNGEYAATKEMIEKDMVSFPATQDDKDMNDNDNIDKDYIEDFTQNNQSENNVVLVHEHLVNMGVVGIRNQKGPDNRQRTNKPLEKATGGKETRKRTNYNHGRVDYIGSHRFTKGMLHKKVEHPFTKSTLRNKVWLKNILHKAKLIPAKPILPVPSLEERIKQLRLKLLSHRKKESIDTTTHNIIQPHGPQYLLMRAIGNDLPPRHKIGQSYENVKFILDNEPILEGVEKRWLINRIVNQTEEQRIISLLDNYNQTYSIIKLNLTEYFNCTVRYEPFPSPDIIRSKYYRNADQKTKALILDEMHHHKILYAMNNNGARNTMLTLGKVLGARWLLPFDGNCFFTKSAWDSVIRAAHQYGNLTKYLSIPMARVQNNNALKNPAYRPIAMEEPQIMFRYDSRERFNPTMRYGRRPKVELLWRLGIEGPWDNWVSNLLWDQTAYQRPPLSHDMIEDGRIPTAGWVARLYSGKGNLETKGALVDRGVHRSKGIQNLLNQIDARIATEHYNFSQSTLLTYDERVLVKEKQAYQASNNSELVDLIHQLIQCANYGLDQGPWSVMDKEEIPPSHNMHDYYTPKPYYWPNPNTPNGLPYVRRDGKRVPGTEMYDKESNKFDRTRLADMFSNTTCLSLAWYFTGDQRYSHKAADNIRNWFLNPKTAMNPHTKYSQIHWGFNENMGESTGVIEFKDFYFFLDGIRLVHRANALSNQEMRGLRDWFRKYQTYLTTSMQGQGEYYSPNNHGLYYDVQSMAISAFIGDIDKFVYQANMAKGRLLGQINPDGTMPHEMIRNTQLHYMFFTLQGWYTIGRMSRKAGINIFNFKRQGQSIQSIRKASIYTIPYFRPNWSHYQEHMTQMDRSLPLYYMALRQYPNMVNRVPPPQYSTIQSMYSVKPIFYVHDGIHPFWNLGLTDLYIEKETVHTLPANASLSL